MGFIKRSWKGETKLWKIYWLYGFLLGIMGTLLIGSLETMSEISGFAIISRLLALILTVIGMTWYNVSVWRCAWNAKAKFWGYIARIFVILFALQFLLELPAMVIHVVPSSAPANHASGNHASVLAVSGTAVAPVGTTLEQRAQAASDTCQKKMTDYAIQQKVDPNAYITQNQAYLQQCIQALSSQNPSCPSNWLGYDLAGYATNPKGQIECGYGGTVTAAECSANQATVIGDWCQKKEASGVVLSLAIKAKE